jgi:hypothetical protein
LSFSTKRLTQKKIFFSLATRKVQMRVRCIRAREKCAVKIVGDTARPVCVATIAAA